MRIDPLCLYIAGQLNTVVSLYDTDGTLFRSFCTRMDLKDPWIEHPEVQRALLTSPEEDTCAAGSPEDAPREFPRLYVVNREIAYAVFFMENENLRCVIGPVRIFMTSPSSRVRHALTVTLSDTEDPLPVLTECASTLLLTNALLLYNMFQPEDLDLWDCYRMNFDQEQLRGQVEQQTSADLFENRENEKMHNPYGQEARLMNSIETGNIEQLKASWQETYPGVLGTTSKDPVRNGKNMAIYVISASARAAVRGGLQPELAYTLTDSYCQKVDTLTDLSLLEPLVKDAELNLTQMVARQRASRNGRTPEQEQAPVIENCKKYIFRHLHSRLTVQEIAAELDIHPNYLSALFRQQEGIPLYRYILQQKVELTKNLLTYSSYSYIEIANYLGFSSQSHLGATFKSVTGMTLKEFRDRYHKEEF